MIVKKDKPTNGRKEIIAKSSMITALCASNVLLNTPIIILKDTHTKNTTILINEESKIEDESKNPNYQLYNIEENDDMLTELKDTHSSDAIIEMEYDSTKPETILAIKNQLLQDNTLRTTLNDILNQFVNQATPIAPIEYIPEINESSSTTVLEEQEYIRKYCDIFGLNNEKVYQILYNITDGFQNEKYVK